MNESIVQTEEANFQLFRDCLATPLIKGREPNKISRKRRSIKKTSETAEIHRVDAEEFGDFLDVSPHPEWYFK